MKQLEQVGLIARTKGTKQVQQLDRIGPMEQTRPNSTTQNKYIKQGAQNKEDQQD